MSDDLPDEKKVALSEWQTARDMIKAYDDRTHDLWKYGFGFITALLAAQSLLLPSLSGGSGTPLNTSAIPDVVKLGVLSVTLVLIVFLRQVEKIYQLSQKLANSRALILERQLNVELSDTITSGYETYRMPWRIFVVYFGFVIAVAFLGFFILSTAFDKFLLLEFSLFAIVFLLWIEVSGLHYRRIEKGDWSFDKIDPVQGDIVRITLTNVSEERGDDIVIPKGAAAFGTRLVESAFGPAKKPTIKYAAEDIRIFAGHDYHTWFWDTSSATPGSYEVYPTVDHQYVDKLSKWVASFDLRDLRRRGRKPVAEHLNEMKVLAKSIEADPSGEPPRWLWYRPVITKITVHDKKREPRAREPSHRQSPLPKPDSDDSSGRSG